MGPWEIKFRKFFEEEKNRIYSYHLFSKCIFGQFKEGEVKDILDDNKKYLSEDFYKLFEYVVKEAEKKKSYSASIFPTLISINLAKNFFFRNEKIPTRDEIFYYLYMISTGVFYNNFVINLITPNENAWLNFLDKLKSEESFILLDSNDKKAKGIQLSSLVKYLYIGTTRIPRVRRNILVFILINFFVVWWLRENKNIRVNSLEETNEVLVNEGLDERAALIVFEYGKEKRKFFIYPRINEFIQKWYFKYLKSGDERDLFLPRFLFSLVDFRNEQSINDLDKFIYFLIRGYVSGELIDRLIRNKINQIRDNKENSRVVSTIKNAKDFFEVI